MSANKKEKVNSPFDRETDEDTIALSMDELDDILSEAEIVQETGEKKAEVETEPLTETQEEEFDISGEIDELSPEDLETIGIEEKEVDAYARELEEEIGKGAELPEMEEPAFEEDIGEIDLEKMKLEVDLDEEIDLDTFLESRKPELDLESIELKEEKEAGEELIEPPVIGEIEGLEGVEGGVEEAFKEAGIEGLEEGVEVSEPGPGVTEPLEEGGLEVSEKPFEAEVILTEEEEKILNEDLDLEAEAVQEEEVVTITGEELGEMAPAEEEEITLSELSTAEEELLIKGKTPLDKSLMNEITRILKYMDLLLGDLPEEKIKEFAQSEYFTLYKNLFKKLNIS